MNFTKKIKGAIIAIIICAIALVISFYYPEHTVKNEQDALSCTLAVKCNTLLENLDILAPEKIELVPESGLILPEIEVKFSEGETAFDVLERELKKRNIHFEFETATMYNSIYIEGIGNIYGLDAGSLSGWLYHVNGKEPSVGCSQYKLKSGDKIEFLYTCDMGSDL